MVSAAQTFETKRPLVYWDDLSLYEVTERVDANGEYRVVSKRLLKRKALDLGVFPMVFADP